MSVVDHVTIVFGHCQTNDSKCDMCTGACLLYGISRVVIGENSTYLGGDDYLRYRGVEVVNMRNHEMEELMRKFIREKPDLWNEDIGVETKDTCELNV